MSNPGICDAITQSTSVEVRTNATSTLTDDVAVCYETHRAKIYRFLIGQGLDPDNAQELTQEVFVQLFVTLKSGRKVESERAWLYRVASNLAVNYWRREGGPMWVQLDSMQDAIESFSSSDSTPEMAAVEGQKLRRVAEAMASLPKEQRLSIHLRMKGLRYKEIAKVLGVSLSTANALLSVAVERLRSTANE